VTTGLGIDAILGRAKPPTRSATICLDADLQAEWDRAQADLEDADRLERSSLGDGTHARLAEQVRDIEARMKAATATFRFRGLSMYALGDLQRKHPVADGQRGTWDIEAGAAELLARTAVEPTMTEQQARLLLDQLSHGQADKLVTAAWSASTGAVDVPFSARASEKIRPPAP
jgi:hypothetical protein